MNVKLHAFRSIAGGVGKTTLAVYEAYAEASKDKAALVVLVSTDFLGVSLARQLPLTAPLVTAVNRQFLVGDVGSYATQKSTRAHFELRMKNWHAASSGRQSVATLNDFMLYKFPAGYDTVDIDGLLWVPPCPPQNLRMIVTSDSPFEHVPIQQLIDDDARTAFFETRLERLVVELIERARSDGYHSLCVIFDTPSGISRVSQAVENLVLRFSATPAPRAVIRGEKANETFVGLSERKGKVYIVITTSPPQIAAVQRHYIPDAVTTLVINDVGNRAFAPDLGGLPHHAFSYSDLLYDLLDGTGTHVAELARSFEHVMET